MYATIRWPPECQGDAPEGMFILESSAETILPETFINDSRKLFDQVVKQLTSHYYYASSTAPTSSIVD